MNVKFCFAILLSSILLYTNQAIAAAEEQITEDSTETQTELFSPILSYEDYDGVPAEEYCHFGELNIDTTYDVYDSLLISWYEQNMFSSYEKFYRDFIDIDSTASLVSSIPDSVYSMRMKAILSPISMGYNETIKQYLILYTQKRKDMMGRMIGLSQVYFPLFEEELAREGLPLELRILPIVESALNPVAISRAGATGLWQFMYATGKAYGLEITSFVDQRRDPVASTKAAVKYLKDLYLMYGDWTLALAAYNCGPGNVQKALNRAGENAHTFWDVYPFLPRETRGYVPSFIAATYAFTYYKQHGIEPVAPELPVLTDTIMVNHLMHFDQITSTMDVSKETLRALNPQYKLDIIPALDKTYPLMLPLSDISTYLQNEDSILAKDTVYLAQYLQQSPTTNQKVFNITSTTYKVKSGDTLGAIAVRYGVTVKQLMSWNHIKNANTLRIGQTLEIYR